MLVRSITGSTGWTTLGLLLFLSAASNAGVPRNSLPTTCKPYRRACHCPASMEHLVALPSLILTGRPGLGRAKMSTQVG